MGMFPEARRIILVSQAKFGLGEWEYLTRDALKRVRRIMLRMIHKAPFDKPQIWMTSGDDWLFHEVLTRSKRAWLTIALDVHAPLFFDLRGFAERGRCHQWTRRKLIPLVASDWPSARTIGRELMLLAKH